MKNFDIENLERKNIYKTPKGFFNDVQERVLQQTAQKSPVIGQRSAKIFRINWSYAAAAAVVLFLGFIGIIQYDESTSTVQNEKDSVRVFSDKKAELSDSQYKQDVQKTVYQPELKTKTSAENKSTLPVKTMANLKPAVQPDNKVAPTPIQPEPETSIEDKLDQMMAVMPTADFADLSKAAEQDVYLDVYN